MIIHRTFPLVVGIVFSFAVAGHGAVVTFHAGSMYASAWDGKSGDVNNTLPASLPLDTTHTVTDDIASNTSAYLFNHSALLISVDHARGTFGSTNTASRHTIPIEFSVNQDTPYSLSGFYNLAGENRITLYAQLVDASAGNAVLFRNQQHSTNTPGQAFTLGEIEGDGGGFPSTQFLSGSLNGTLLAGHHYKLEYNFLIQRTTTTAGSATASGQLLLQIPEPASLTLVAIAGLLLIRHQRHAP